MQATQQPQPSLSNNSFAVLADNEPLPQRPLPKRPNKPHTSNVATYISEEITRISTNQSQPNNNNRQRSTLDQPTETNDDWLYIKALTYAAQLNTPTGPSEPTSDSNQTPPPNHHPNPNPNPNPESHF
ncbi:UNVERIFIED_CONTAM: hypothetical protein FKN15_001567 [Acipenser sinensis]